MHNLITKQQPYVGVSQLSFLFISCMHLRINYVALSYYATSFCQGQRKTLFQHVERQKGQTNTSSQKRICVLI